MAPGTRNQVDLAAGVMYLVVAAAFAVGAKDLRLGTAANMGPGYFPLAVSSLLALSGLIVIGRALSRGEPSARLAGWRAGKLSLILGAVIVFALLLPHAGLLVSTVALVLLSSLASDEFDWRVALGNAVALAGIGAVIFIYGLSLPIPLAPRFLGG